MSFGSIFDPLILTPDAANLVRRWLRSRGILLHLIPEEAGGRDEARRGCDGGDGSCVRGGGWWGPSSSASVPLSSTGGRAGTEHAQQGARTGLPATALATQGVERLPVREKWKRNWELM